MAVAEQIITLAGVGVGAVVSFAVTALNERARFRRELATRWDSSRLEAYASYLAAVANLARVSGDVAKLRGINDVVTWEIDEGLAMPLLIEAEGQRRECFEKVALLGDYDTVAAGHALNSSLWTLENMAVKPGAATKVDWENAAMVYFDSLFEFHHAARRHVGVQGELAEGRWLLKNRIREQNEQAD